MIDASRGFMKDGNKNRLREQDIHKIVDLFNRQVELPRYGFRFGNRQPGQRLQPEHPALYRLVGARGPARPGRAPGGGIPNRDIDALEVYWEVLPGVRAELFKGNGRPGYSEARVESQQVKAAILRNAEFAIIEESPYLLASLCVWLRYLAGSDSCELSVEERLVELEQMLGRGEALERFSAVFAASFLLGWHCRGSVEDGEEMESWARR